MAKVENHLWTVLVRGDDRLAKKNELKARVEETERCRVIRDMLMEGTGFIYIMASTVRRNPLLKYIGKTGGRVQLKAHKKATLVAGAETEEADEGAGIPGAPEDENSD